MEKNINRFTSMIEQSIGVSEPWFIRGAEFLESEKEVHIYIGIRDSTLLPCPECGEQCCRYGYEEKERIWRHGDCLFYPSYVHCQRPRIKCEKHGVKVVDAPWARRYSRFTLLFEGYVVILLRDMPILKVSELLRCDAKSLVSIAYYWVGDAERKDDLSEVTALGIDETSFKKRHQYVTVVIDAVKRRVIDVEEGRDIGAVLKFSYKLELKGGDCNRITQVSSDMSRAYMNGVAEAFPYAKLTIDKFHVKKMALEGLDEVRRSEQRTYKSKLLNNSKKFLMIPLAKMDADQIEKASSLSKQFPNVGKAFRMVALLDQVYASPDLASAASTLDRLIRWMRRSRLEPMKKVAATLKTHRTEILNIFTTRLTNAICEGINSMIQAAKRKARGYKTLKGFICMIYLVASKLTLACPNPLRI